MKTQATHAAGPQRTKIALILRETGEDKRRAKTGAKKKSASEPLELQLISIRLPKTLVRELKAQAGRQGIGYQPFIRQILMNQMAMGAKLGSAISKFSDDLAERVQFTEAAISGLRSQLSQVETQIGKKIGKSVRQAQRSSSKFARRVAKNFKKAGSSR
jgi:hypothetical protein